MIIKRPRLSPRNNSKMTKRTRKLFLKIKTKKMLKNGWPQTLLRQLIKPKLLRIQNLMIKMKFHKLKRPKCKKKSLRQNPSKLKRNQPKKPKRKAKKKSPKFNKKLKKNRSLKSLKTLKNQPWKKILLMIDPLIQKNPN